MKKKIIALLLLIIISIIGGMFISTKYIESKNKDYDETLENLSSEQSDIEILENSIKTSFNKKCEYKVIDGSLKINDTYKYIEDPIEYTFMGKSYTAEPTIIKAGSAEVQYQYNVLLNKAEVKKVNNSTIRITVPYPELDVDSVKKKEGTFNLDESKSSISFSAKIKLMEQAIYTEYNETMDARATRKLEDNIDKVAPEKIKAEYKSNEEKRIELEESTIDSVKSLCEILQTDTNINIDVLIK